jgi:predicted  nucleic acid-binding Zn-ribbon protein
MAHHTRSWIIQWLIVYFKRTEQLHELEMKHQQGASESDLLIKDEDVRRLKLRILILRDENTTLRDQIIQSNDENAELTTQCEDLGAQLEAKIQVVRSQEKQLRKQEREFSNLKVRWQCALAKYSSTDVSDIE